MPTAPCGLLGTCGLHVVDCTLWTARVDLACVDCTARGPRVLRVSARRKAIYLICSDRQLLYFGFRQLPFDRQLSVRVMKKDAFLSQLAVQRFVICHLLKEHEDN